MQPLSETCQDLLHFLNTSPTPYHAVESSCIRLQKQGATLLEEHHDFSKLPKGTYVMKRGDSALVAFTLPSKQKITGFRVIGAHTDSPNLRLKPQAEYSKEGYFQLGVEVYGGVLLNSWLDRDLSLAGRVMVMEKGRIESRLVHFSKPMLRIPQLAIHLDREVNEKGLLLNRQEHLAPIWSLISSQKVIPSLLKLCAEQLNISEDHILRTEFMLYDTAPAIQAGLYGEFLFSSRFDNLAMCHASLSAFLQAQALLEDGIVPVIVHFDHEEVGSESAYGASAPLLPMILERLVLACHGSRESYHQTIANSFCISADMGHAVHPNYPERHETRHRPQLNKGPIIKINAQQRYATCAKTAALFQTLCEEAEVPYQTYVHRTDLPCGSTIGPITSAQLGIKTVDVGNPLLSMHSIREMAGALDPDFMVKPLTRFLSCPPRF